MAVNASDKILIEKSLSGDLNSFRRLVEYYQPLVYSIAFRFLRNSADSEDIVQECFLKVWKNLSTYKLDYKFSTWIYKIVVNLCMDQFRKKKIIKTIYYEDIPGSVTNPGAEKYNLEDTIITNEMIRYVNIAVDNLSPKQKMIFVLSELEGIENDEISKILNVSTGNIKSNLYYARKNIRIYLDKIYKTNSV